MKLVRSNSTRCGLVVILAVFVSGLSVAQDESESSATPTKKDASPAAAAGEKPTILAADAEDLLRTGDRLLTEERRQLDVRRRLSSVKGKIDWLLADLQSNGLMEEGGGKKIEEMNTRLVAIGTKHVPKAAGLLRQARGDIDKSPPHIVAADVEIDTILIELDKVLRGAGSVLVDDALVKQLREIITQEEFLRRQTATWGKKMILAPQAANVDQGRLQRSQQSVIGRYAQFFALLSKAASDALDDDSKERLEGSRNILRDKKPEIALSRAIDQISRKQAIGAVTEQDKAIAALKEALEILGADEEEVSDAVLELERIIAAQKLLKSDTESAEGNRFRQEQSHLEARQIEIGRDVAILRGEGGAAEAAVLSAELSSETVQKALGEAAGHIKTAEKSLNRGRGTGEGHRRARVRARRGGRRRGDGSGWRRRRQRGRQRDRRRFRRRWLR